MHVMPQWGVRISIHALREESDLADSPVERVRVGISIHALREESDSDTSATVPATAAISIHALREESDADRMDAYRCGLGFQSTLSVRRATQLSWYRQQHDRISIHALREESDG